MVNRNNLNNLVGHLSYQCRNNFKLKTPQSSKIETSIVPASVLEIIKVTNDGMILF